MIAKLLLQVLLPYPMWVSSSLLYSYVSLSRLILPRVPSLQRFRRFLCSPPSSILRTHLTSSIPFQSSCCLGLLINTSSVKDIEDLPRSPFLPSIHALLSDPEEPYISSLYQNIRFCLPFASLRRPPVLRPLRGSITRPVSSLSYA